MGPARLPRREADDFDDLLRPQGHDRLGGQVHPAGRWSSARSTRSRSAGKTVFPRPAAVRPEKAGTIDLGTLRAGAYPPKSLANAEEMSSFKSDAPGAGKVAPPIEATTLDGKPLKLDDFKGRYVLLDFWATWCGPCIGEIPQLQAVHDAFGKDERFAILSLSVDEKIEEPKKFQEKRRLPWSQAFLGRRHSWPDPRHVRHPCDSGLRARRPRRQDRRSRDAR